MKSTFIATAALAVAACATPTLQAPPQNMEFGQPPENPEAEIRAYMEMSLKDPESARYKIEPPYRAYANQSPRDGGVFLWHGYRVDFYINAKNSFGGYTGFKPYFAMFRDGKLVSAYPAESSTWVFTTVRE